MVGNPGRTPISGLKSSGFQLCWNGLFLKRLSEHFIHSIVLFLPLVRGSFVLYTRFGTFISINCSFPSPGKVPKGTPCKGTFFAVKMTKSFFQKAQFIPILHFNHEQGHFVLIMTNRSVNFPGNISIQTLCCTLLSLHPLNDLLQILEYNRCSISHLLCSFKSIVFHGLTIVFHGLTYYWVWAKLLCNMG